MSFCCCGAVGCGVDGAVASVVPTAQHRKLFNTVNSMRNSSRNQYSDSGEGSSRDAQAKQALAVWKNAWAGNTDFDPRQPMLVGSPMIQ
jgi:hypothetical protein